MNDNDLSDVDSVISDLGYMSDLDIECQSVNFDLSNGSPINVNNFNIVHYNINSITAEGRLDQLSDICSILKDLFGFNHTVTSPPTPKLMSVKGANSNLLTFIPFTKMTFFYLIF